MNAVSYRVGLDDELLGAPSAPRPAQQGRDSRDVAVARTPPHRIPSTSRWYAHRDTSTAGARQASRRGRAGDRAGSSAAAASSTSHRCNGPARRLRA